ncbi:hypothetical protein DNC80_04080 [Flavobacterium sp. SOK18b]|uniref:HNH endonuclease n=1 Tax=Flavobacterium sp. SOK18b TaxID=797900 RepID=UPI0015FB09DE|nr:HNH endonuclease [Flavobacterium sp. SOK18b]MBB1192844.1 hypothetical protein [Flavobacterium sp. SOK18b]
MTNKYGLSRTIPSEIKREIRQNSGFGCVVCGLGIIEYEHVEPEFKEAEKHDPTSITLLCPNCHSKVTRGMWSKEKIKDAMQNPICLQKGYSNDFFDIGNNYPKIKFAGSLIMNTPIPIMVKGKPLFKIIKSESEKFFLLSAIFYNSKGEKSLEIIDNEWFAYSDNWDITAEGNTITIRERHKEICLELVVNPPDLIIINRLIMQIENYKICGNPDYFEVFIDDILRYKLSNIIANNCGIGISL